MKYFRHKKTHGLFCGKNGKFPPIYNVWRNMRQRCNNYRNPLYKYYGKRGIKICKRWDYFPYFSKDMGIPKKGYELDRINVNGNYSKINCRWVDKKTQQRNQRRTIYLEYKGVRRRLVEWAEIFNLPPDKIRKRLYTGKSLDRAFSKFNHIYKDKVLLKI